MASKLAWAVKGLRRTPELVAAIGVIVTGVAVYHFWNSHPPDDVSLSAQHVSRVLMIQDATAQMTGYARNLFLHSATGQVDVVVPVAATQCPVLAAKFNTTCDGGGMTVPSLVVQWTKPQPFSVPTVAAKRVELSSVAPESGGGLRLTATDGQIPRVCMLMDTGPANLTLQAASPPFTLPGDAGIVHMCDGVVIHVQTATPSGTAVLVLQDLAAATSTLSGKKMTLSAESETLTLVSISSDLPFTRPIEIDSDRLFQVNTQGIPPDVALPGDVYVQHALHVEVTHAERLANETTRNPLASWTESAIPAAIGLVVWLLTRTLRRRKK